MANIERNTLMNDMRMMSDALLPGGALLLSGFVTGGPPHDGRSAKDAGLIIAERMNEGEWALVGCRKNELAVAPASWSRGFKPHASRFTLISVRRGAVKRVAHVHRSFDVDRCRSFAQTKTFTTDQALFLEEMTKFLEEADKKEARALHRGDVHTGVERHLLQRRSSGCAVVEVANYMLKKRFEAFPAFRDYLAALAAFANSGRSAAEFDAWMSSLEQARAERAQAEFR